MEWAIKPSSERRVRAMGIRDRPTGPRSPWQNGYIERLIGSIRSGGARPAGALCGGENVYHF